MEQLYPSQSQLVCNATLCVARESVKVQSRRKYVFTEQIDQLIREVYLNHRDGKTRFGIRPLAKKVGMPHWALKKRARELGGLTWQGMQATIQQLKKGTDVDFVIGCVDTRKARRTIDKWVLSSRVLYWLDLGNGASSGHFVLGQPKNSANRKKRHRLPTVAELYPEILKRDKKEDSQPSCSAAEALTRQEPFINQNLAYQALGLLTQLLRHGSVSYQGGFCNLATGQLVPLAIRAVPARA